MCFIRRRSAIFLLLLTTALGSATSLPDQTFSMPDSTMLFATPYSNLRLVAGANVQVLDPPVKQGGVFSSPSLASDGSRVAWAFFAEDPKLHQPPRYSVGIYAVAGRQWKLYGSFGTTGPVALSPDGLRVAFVSEESMGNKDSFMVLDLSTGEIAERPTLARTLETSHLSWAPNGKELAVALYRRDHSPSLAIVDPDSADVKIIGEGTDPAWSPAGDWIAFLDQSAEKCLLVHPDGTGTKVVRNLDRAVGVGHRMFVYGAVWSPDGKELLLNELKGEGPNVDVVLLDLSTGRVTTKTKNGIPVFGWIRQMH